MKHSTIKVILHCITLATQILYASIYQNVVRPIVWTFFLILQIRMISVEGMDYSLCIHRNHNIVRHYARIILSLLKTAQCLLMTITQCSSAVT